MLPNISVLYSYVRLSLSHISQYFYFTPYQLHVFMTSSFRIITSADATQPTQFIKHHQIKTINTRIILNCKNDAWINSEAFWQWWDTLFKTHVLDFCPLFEFIKNHYVSESDSTSHIRWTGSETKSTLLGSSVELLSNHGLRTALEVFFKFLLLEDEKKLNFLIHGGFYYIWSMDKDQNNCFKQCPARSSINFVLHHSNSSLTLSLSIPSPDVCSLACVSANIKCSLLVWKSQKHFNCFSLILFHFSFKILS
jgi:hypothetical protein